MKFFSTLLLAGALAPGALAQSKDLFLANAHIETGDGKVIGSGGIYIHDGKIAAVGESLQPPAEATVIDLKGAYVYPGFIDAYSTDGLKLPDAPSSGPAPDSRNTAPATMWHANKKGIRSDVVAAKCLDLSGKLKDAYGMGITTSLLASGSGSVRGIASVVDMVGKGSVLLSDAAGEFSLRGGGGGGGGYPGTLFGTTALTRQVLIDAQAYAANPPAKKDAGLENLKPVATGQIPAMLAADTARELVRAKRFTDEFGLKLIINGGKEAYRELSWIKSGAVPVILTLDVTEAPSKKMDTGPDATPQQVLDERYDAWVEHSKNAQILSAAGVPLAFGLGGGFADYLKGVRAYLSEGLTHDAALKAMTLGAAQILGVGDKVGSIAPGKLANLTVLSGDFGSDKSTVLSVVVEGTVIDQKKGSGK